MRVATGFTVDGDRISAVLRHTDLTDALTALGLTTADEVRHRG